MEIFKNICEFIKGKKHLVATFALNDSLPLLSIGYIYEGDTINKLMCV